MYLKRSCLSTKMKVMEDYGKHNYYKWDKENIEKNVHNQRNLFLKVGNTEEGKFMCHETTQSDICHDLFDGTRSLQCPLIDLVYIKPVGQAIDLTYRQVHSCRQVNENSICVHKVYWPLLMKHMILGKVIYGIDWQDVYNCSNRNGGTQSDSYRSICPF